MSLLLLFRSRNVEKRDEKETRIWEEIVRNSKRKVKRESDNDVEEREKKRERETDRRERKERRQ
ncbi:uncharacterized protein LOC106879688 [Octopus bimaculoides]|uniref:uncharacterized protein LOC106879688 n=1 Tax=Octopus bimaculoides TaxID=37653 RepID=UPI00071E5373|nr:uncharacterized protein LOC106879688 [Octopus bimaculoides]|eukprot:XP_014784852.1 PREDICTED: uncharacterized protein LOC106879688 [Octopus bimaculoides]